MRFKRILLLFLIICCAGELSASEEVYLDLNTPEIHRYNTGTLQYENTKINDEEDENYLKPSFQSMKKMFEEDFYRDKTITTKKEKNFGKYTVGAKCDTTLKTDSINSSRTLFTKSELTEKMSVDTSYKNNTTGKMNDQLKGTVSIAPEYKFTEKISVKNVFSKNLGDKSDKTELQLRYKPFSDDRMDLNVGAGQKSYDNGQHSSSQVNFGTNIRF